MTALGATPLTGFGLATYMATIMVAGVSILVCGEFAADDAQRACGDATQPIMGKEEQEEESLGADAHGTRSSAATDLGTVVATSLAAIADTAGTALDALDTLLLTKSSRVIGEAPIAAAAPSLLQRKRGPSAVPLRKAFDDAAVKDSLTYGMPILKLPEVGEIEEEIARASKGGG